MVYACRRSYPELSPLLGGDDVERVLLDAALLDKAVGARAYLGLLVQVADDYLHGSDTCPHAHIREAE